jgi:hypothetical protein
MKFKGGCEMKKENSEYRGNGDMYKFLDKCFQTQFRAWKDFAEIQLDFNQKFIDACLQQWKVTNNSNDLFATDTSTAGEYSRVFFDSTREVMEKLFKAECEMLDYLSKSGEMYKDMPLFMLPTSKEEDSSAKQQISVNKQD